MTAAATAAAAAAVALIAVVAGSGLATPAALATPSAPGAPATPGHRAALPSPRAPSATELEVAGGYGGGQFVAGRMVPVRVRITADRLVAGDLRVQADTPGGPVGPIVVPVEVPGGSTKDVVVALPTPPGIDSMQVRAGFGEGTEGTDGVVGGEAELTSTGDTELVGLLPGLVDQAPQQVQLPMGLGTARFANLDGEPAVPGALDPLGTIVTGPGGLGDLEQAARRTVLDWVERGGRLVVDTEPGARVGGVPTEWQPGDASRRAAGRGEIRFSGGAATEGRWDEVVEPTPLVQPGEVVMQMFFAPGDVGTSVASDGGFRIPSLGWLLGFLVVYVLLAGPVAFLLVRRRGVVWSWAALPALAVVFAAVAFVVGSDARRGSQSAHGTAVETSPAGARAATYLGLVSRTGADGHADFPAGWSVTSGPGMPGGGMAGGIGAVPLPAPRRPGVPDGGGGGDRSSRITVAPEATTGEVELDPGDFGLLRGSGPLDDATPGLEVTATALADGSVRGTVRNTTDVTLRQVLVLVGDRSWDGDALEPGQEAEWQLAPDEGDGGMGEPPEAPWRDAIGWDSPPDPDHPVSYELWSELLLTQTDPYRPGWVTAAGWTRDWSPPIDPGGDLEAGRTVFTTRAPVAAEAGAVPGDAVRRELLRGPRVTESPVAPAGGGADGKDDEPAWGDDWGPTSGAVVRFALPDGADPATPLEVALPGPVVRAEWWDGARWVPLPEPDDGGAPIQDPFDPRANRSIPLPAGAVRDGAVHLRVGVLSDVLEPSMTFTVREAAA